MNIDMETMTLRVEISFKVNSFCFYLFVDTASKIDRHLLSTVGSTRLFLFTNTVNYKYLALNNNTVNPTILKKEATI